MCCPHEWGFWEATPSLGETCLMVAEKKGHGLGRAEPVKLLCTRGLFGSEPG